MKKIACFLVLVLFLNFISCTKGKVNEKETEETLPQIGVCYHPPYYSDNIDSFIDTWRKEYTDDDNFFVVEDKNYADILIIPKIDGYEIANASLSLSRDYYEITLKNFDKRYAVEVKVIREPVSLVDYLLRREFITDSSELSSDIFNRYPHSYINFQGLVIDIWFSRGEDYKKTKEELLEFLNFEVLYPYDNATDATSS